MSDQDLAAQLLVLAEAAILHEREKALLRTAASHLDSLTAALAEAQQDCDDYKAAYRETVDSLAKEIETLDADLATCRQALAAAQPTP